MKEAHERELSTNGDAIEVKLCKAFKQEQLWNKQIENAERERERTEKILKRFLWKNACLINPDYCSSIYIQDQLVTE